MTTASEWVQGSDGTTGTSTDLTIENLEAREIEVLLSFTSFSGKTPPLQRLRLEPFATREMVDVLSGLPEDGTFRVEAADGSRASLALRARSYMASGPVRRTADSGASFLAGLSQTDAFDVLVEARGSASSSSSVTMRLRSADGRLIGVQETRIPAAGDVRWSLADLFPDAWGEGLSLELVGSVGSPAPDVRAEVTDLRTGSRVDVQATRAVERSYLPATARTVTPSGSSLATDATILNPSDSPLSVRLLFLEDDRDNGAAPVAALRLGAGESRSIEDILGTFFGVAEASGILEIEADRRVLVVFGTQTVRSEGTRARSGRLSRPSIPTGSPERACSRSRREGSAGSPSSIRRRHLSPRRFVGSGRMARS